MPVIANRVDRTSPMGATPAVNGTGFRTWAPNAQAVAVLAGAPLAAAQAAGAAWQPAAGDALIPLGDGSWGGFLAGTGDGDSYMFYVQGPGGNYWKRDPAARELTLQPPFDQCYCIIRDPTTYPWHDAGWTPRPYRDLTIYQLHIGTWCAQNPDGSDARGTRGGRLLDAVDKLTYLRDLGIGAVQLLPIQEFESRFSMGYNGVDYFSPEGQYQVPAAEIPRYLATVNASLAQFGQPPLTATQLTPGVNQLKCLIDLCHLHGIAVIFDLVYNHAGGGFDDRSLFFFDCQVRGDNNRSLYFTDQGWAGGLIFAYWNDWVAQFLIDNACFFLTEYRIDGIRYDEVRVIENNDGRRFCQNLTQTVRATKPGAIQIAEYWNPDRPSAVQPPPAGLGFDAELADRLRDALRGLLSQAAGGAAAALHLGDVAAALVPQAGFDAGWRLVQCLENQDLTYAGHGDAGAARVAMLADASDRHSWYARSRARVATSLLLAAPGIPALFMGQEFLEDKLWSDNLIPNNFIEWDCLTAANPTNRDFLRCITDLIALRGTLDALRSDSSRVSRANDFERVLVLHRWVEGGEQDVVVVASLDEQPKHEYWIGLPFPGAWQEVWNSDYYDTFPNPATVGNGGQVSAWGGPLDGFAASAALTLPGNGVIVLAR